MNWLQNHLIPCPFKKLTGIDCPGCGFQRSVIALVKGNLSDSFHFYPATIPFLLTILFVLFSCKLHADNKHIIKKTLYMITGSVIIVSYVIKMYGLYR
jgi:hypothetical protein